MKYGTLGWVICFLLSLNACSPVTPTVREDAGQGPPSETGTAPAQKDQGDFRALNDLGVTYLRESRFDEAFIQFQKSLALNPDYARAHFNLAIVYYKKGVMDREIEEYQKAIRIDPEYFHARLNLGHALLAKGMEKTAAKEYRWALGKDPNNRKALYNLAVILFDQKEKTEASKLFTRYLDLDPKSTWADSAREYLQKMNPGDMTK
jgi:tetratricopeptide (TPR) repeat protein